MESCRFSKHKVCRLAAVVVAGLLGIEARGGDNVYVVQSRISSSNFQLFLNILDDSTVAIPGAPLFVIAGGVYGAAFKDGTFYGVELENGTGKEFLITVAATGIGARVSASEIGFPNIEGLACVGSQLIACSLNFATHMTRFVNVDSTTGTGTFIGAGSFDVMIVAMAYDPSAQVLYGAGIPWGDPVTGVTTHNLYTVNPATGATTLVGPLGAEIQSLTYNDTLGLVGGFAHFYSIHTGTGAATQIGLTDFTDGLGTGPGIFNGLYAMAAPRPAVIPPFAIDSISRDLSNTVHFTWESETGYNYQTECSTTMVPDSWGPAAAPDPRRNGAADSGVIPAVTRGYGPR